MLDIERHGKNHWTVEEETCSSSKCSCWSRTKEEKNNSKKYASRVSRFNQSHNYRMPEHRQKWSIIRWNFQTITGMKAFATIIPNCYRRLRTLPLAPYLNSNGISTAGTLKIKQFIVGTVSFWSFKRDQSDGSAHNQSAISVQSGKIESIVRNEVLSDGTFWPPQESRKGLPHQGK
ncbi:hypothetical protein WH47_01149 [Habropoda laboriosa]|uniref:Uncharacterized protein n=1 Tax=Habropoda laboriosa TaxID=597456 RepID=A0A0L7QYW4_9HYME|nr:hypothetical protein WH47_01149 [Habropoda laboriosa]